MLSEKRVVNLSCEGLPVVPLYERDRGLNVPVLYVLVRTDYEETEEMAIIRANRIADWLTDDVARRKSKKVTDSE